MPSIDTQLNLKPGQDFKDIQEPDSQRVPLPDREKIFGLIRALERKNHKTCVPRVELVKYAKVEGFSRQYLQEVVNALWKEGNAALPTASTVTTLDPLVVW